MRVVLMLAALLASGLSHAAERVVTLAPHLAELVCAAGGCNKLVGVANYTDFPAQAAQLPRIGDAITVNLEQVIALQPDLILAWDGGTPQGTVERLRKLGLRVETVRIRALDEVADALLSVGAYMQTPAAAALAVAAYQQRLQSMRRQYQQTTPLRVMYQIERDPIYTISALSPIDEAIRLCGGSNVFAKLPQIAGTVSLEAVLAADPQVVIFAQQDNERAIRELWARWPQAQAQKSGNIYAVDANLLARQSPRLLDGVEQLCRVLETARGKFRLPR